VERVMAALHEAKPGLLKTVPADPRLVAELPARMVHGRLGRDMAVESKQG
jgi:hypothetical protein